MSLVQLLDRDMTFKEFMANEGMPYIDISRSRQINNNLGCASKYVGPDETGEKNAPHRDIADFGFDTRTKPKKHKYRDPNWRKLQNV